MLGDFSSKIPKNLSGRLRRPEVFMRVFFYAVQLPEVKGENVCLSNSSMRVQSGGTALLNRFHTVNLDRCFLSAL